MSPQCQDGDLALPGFPRVSGDEPTWSLVVPQMTQFSPRERG